MGFYTYHFNYFNDSSVQFWAIIFIIPFIIHTGYIVYKDELNVANRKSHYLWIIFSYGISYLITQISLYGKIDANEIAPIDILSVNTFFLVMWLLAQASIWNFLFLRRALPLTKEELGEEEPELSRTSKEMFRISLKFILNNFKIKHQNMHVRREEVSI